MRVRSDKADKDSKVDTAVDFPSCREELAGIKPPDVPVVGLRTLLWYVAARYILKRHPPLSK
jgi:hypothetical protein